MHHGRLSPLTGQGIHIAGLDTDTGDLFLGAAADSLHVCSEQGIHAGNTDHDNFWALSLSLKAAAELRNSFGDLFQMAAGDKICLIHRQIEKAVLVTRHAADGGSVPAAAAGRNDQHDRTGNGKACALDPITLRTGRVKGQGGRRTVDQMGCGHKLTGNIIASARGKLRRCVKYWFFFLHE